MTRGSPHWTRTLLARSFYHGHRLRIRENCRKKGKGYPALLRRADTCNDEVSFHE